MSTENTVPAQGQKFELEAFALVQRQAQLFMHRLVSEYSLSNHEQIRMVNFLNGLIEDYRDLGIADSVHSMITALGGGYSAALPDPRPEAREKSKNSALKVIAELREMDFSTAEINSLSPEMKKLTELATLWGNTEGLNMMDSMPRK